jgi:hypothetical protein
MPDEVYQLIALYPQSQQAQPSVFYLPVLDTRPATQEGKTPHSVKNATASIEERGLLRAPVRHLLVVRNRK